MSSKDNQDKYPLISIKNVRISFPFLFEKGKNSDGGEGKYRCTFLLDPEVNKADIAALQQRIVDLQRDRKLGVLAAEKKCLRRGDDLGRAEYAGLVVLNVGSVAQPVVLHGNATKVRRAEDNPIYAGCYVNAKIDMWVQDNRHGRRVNGELIAVQFFRDGESFGTPRISEEEAIEGFEACDTGDDFMG